MEDNDNFSVGADASGIAKAEITSLNWENNEFVDKYLQDGVWIDFTATMYIRFGGLKYETSPIFKKIEIIEPVK